ncbi:hypothetical protein [Yoonia maritima]|uniref:hypothetical protein n=1 Tax=Yoonia maritima TaxID=1435347 RepID=UPI003735F42E
MQISIAIERPFAFVRIGHLEVHLERHCERACEGWLVMTRPVAGEVVCNVGRWALHLVNHQRVQTGYAA